MSSRTIRECHQKLKNWLQKMTAFVNRHWDKRAQVFFFVMTIVLVVLCAFNVRFSLVSREIAVWLYAVGGLCFFLSLAMWIKTLVAVVKTVLLPFLSSHEEMISEITSNPAQRAVLSALPGIGIDFFFALYNLGFAIFNRIGWYGAMAGYYALLCAMRFLSVSFAKKLYEPMFKGIYSDVSLHGREILVYRGCGFSLQAMSVLLTIMVIELSNNFIGKIYHGSIIYVVIIYMIYKLVSSIKKGMRAVNDPSLLAKTLSNISFVDALVTLLITQTAMIATFSKTTWVGARVANIVVGGVISVISFIIGMKMVMDSFRIAKLEKKP